MHNINNTISSNTMKYCIITKNIVSTDTFLYPCSTIIYTSQDHSTYFMHNKLFILIQKVFVHPFSTYPTWYIETNHVEVASTATIETRPRQWQTPIVILSIFGQIDGFKLCLVASSFFSDLLIAFFTGARDRWTLVGTGRGSIISHKLHIYPHIPVYFIVENWTR